MLWLANIDFKTLFNLNVKVNIFKSSVKQEKLRAMTKHAQPHIVNNTKLSSQSPIQLDNLHFWQKITQNISENDLHKNYSHTCNV